MNWNNLITAIVVLGFAALVTYIFCCIGFPHSKKPIDGKADVIEAGDLVINSSDPNKDVIRFELAIPIGDLTKYKEVSFKIVDES